jgi:5'-nucleotidase / UDP-sugar diphosphatase
MARAKRKTAKVTPKPVVAEEKTHESRFPNFLLGLTFLIVVLLLISLFFRNTGTQFSFDTVKQLFTHSNSPAAEIPPTPAPTPERPEAGSDYTVQEGDTLWAIAEEAYGSGFNATDITTANKLQNPNNIEVGQHITLPKVEANTPTRGEISGEAVIPTPAQSQPSTATEYTVQKGDSLWSVAVAQYGDGFQWTRIAEANKLVNPRVIHAGNRLIIPR